MSNSATARGNTHPTVGVFDSGFGGLTVLRSLISHLPHARYAFIGDTARLPYGSKSRRTIARYAVESAQFLVREQGADFLVIACNTASALALDAIKDAVPIPVLGVIEPGATAACAASRTGDALVIATDATVQSHAYAAACQGRRARVQYAMKANSNLAILQVFAKLGAGFDIVSGGELQRVLAVGGDPRKVVFSGVGKTAAEMELALGFRLVPTPWAARPA